MNWDAIGAVGETVGALGVVISLAYLAFQIRQNTFAMRSSSYDTFVTRLEALSDLMISNSDAGRAWGKGLSGSEDISVGEKRIFNAVMLRMFRHLEHGYLQRNRGLIEDHLFKLWWQENLWAAAEPGSVAWWNEKRQFFTPEFRQFVDDELS